MDYSLPKLKRFPKTAYKPIADRLHGVKRTTANRRGWGEGWPNCQKNALVRVQANRLGSPRFRRELAELAVYLLKASNALGYDIRLASETDGGVGTFACRAIKHSNPPQASNHSWGLAIDQNSKSNPMGKTWKSTTPPEIVDLWESAGFYWGGRYPGDVWFYDTMHFEYMFRPEDVATDLANAKAAFARLGGVDLYPTLQLDATNRAMVRAMQRRLNLHGANLHEDGVFNLGTDTVVRAFQKAKNIGIDGIVGPITWGELNKEVGA